jgi:hypothetical protein
VNRRPLILLLGLCAVIVAAWAFLARPGPDAETGPARGTPPASPSGPATGAPASRPEPALPQTPDEAIATIMAKLRRGGATAADFEALRQRLLGGDAAQSIAAILAFLQTGDDASTGLEFGIGTGGALTGAPTMRVFLMDLLGQLSRTTHGAEAADYARTVLEKKTTPDEWALSLRNIAWQEPAAAPYLAGKMREMLAEPSWMAAPSAGLLEAFDIIVFTGDPNFIPQLADLARGAGGLTALQRAALVALDRLAEQSPQSVMGYLNEHPGELADRPMLRADYFAKADLAQPPQQAALETYLSRPDVGLEEKTKLIDALASPGSFASDNLVTVTPVTGNEAGRADALAKLYSGWLSSNRFPELRSRIQGVLGRMGR